MATKPTLIETIEKQIADGNLFAAETKIGVKGVFVRDEAVEILKNEGFEIVGSHPEVFGVSKAEGVVSIEQLKQRLGNQSESILSSMGYNAVHEAANAKRLYQESLTRRAAEERRLSNATAILERLAEANPKQHKSR